MSTEKQTVTLELVAVLSDALCMRVPLGSADAPDGTKYEVAVSVSGGEVIVGVYSQGRPRKQYVVTCEALVNAIDGIERQPADVKP